MSIVFFDHDEWPSPQRFPKNDERARDFIAIRKRSWIPWESEAPPKCFLSWSWWTFPFIWGWWMPKKPPSLKPPATTAFQTNGGWTSRCISLRRDVCAMYLVARERWSSVRVKSCAYQVFGLSLGSVETWGLEFEILKLPEKGGEKYKLWSWGNVSVVWRNYDIWYMKYIYIDICMQHAYIYIENIFIPISYHMAIWCLTYQLLDCATFEIPAKKDMQTVTCHCGSMFWNTRAVIGMQTVDQQWHKMLITPCICIVCLDELPLSGWIVPLIVNQHGTSSTIDIDPSNMEATRVSAKIYSPPWN